MSQSSAQFARWTLPLVVLATIAAPAETVLAKAPNIVLILSDDQCWTDFGFMGHPVIRTPHLDRLASQSAVFPRGYVPSSLCRPSLATIISGLYPHQHRISGNDPARGAPRDRMLKHIGRIPTLPRLLSTAGYVSFQAGKWWEGEYSRGGFTAGMTHGEPRRGGRHGDEGLKIGREGVQPIFRFLDGVGDKPFFLWYAPMMPHTPHNPPARLLARYEADGRAPEIARYYAMCEWFDETCGELLGYLDAHGLNENTIVAFVTDNGWIARTADTKAPEGWRLPFAPKSKRSPYDGGVRTPILLRWPNKIAPGRYETLVSSIDLAPTLLAAAGVAPDAEMPGINLVKAIADKGQTPRQAIFGATFAHEAADIDDPAASLQYRWCIEKNWKLILPADETQAPELYDLASDPHENVNLAREHPDRVDRLTQLANRWWPGKPRSSSKPAGR